MEVAILCTLALLAAAASVTVSVILDDGLLGFFLALTGVGLALLAKDQSNGGRS